LHEVMNGPASQLSRMYSQRCTNMLCNNMF